jgi:hypothetical protein
MEVTTLKVRVLIAAFIVLAVFSFAGLLSGPANRLRLELDYESGFTGVIFHTIQFGQSGTVFNYVKDGGQDVLFPFERFTASVGIDRHTVYFLYQPLTVQTKVKLKSDLLVDDVLFPAGTGMVLNYGFPFYRLSYTYDVLRKGDSYLALGLSLQIRNADIYFESLDGTKFVANKNVGPVPVIKVKASSGSTTGSTLRRISRLLRLEQVFQRGRLRFRRLGAGRFSARRVEAYELSGSLPESALHRRHGKRRIE